MPTVRSPSKRWARQRRPPGSECCVVEGDNRGEAYTAILWGVSIEWAPVARTMMEQLSADEQADVRSSVDRVARGFSAANVMEVQRRRQGQRPFFVVRATPTLRVLFERLDDHFRVLDIVSEEQLAYFRDDGGLVP